MQQTDELVERSAIESAVRFHALSRSGPELIEVPVVLGNADDGHVEVAALRHRV